MYIPFLSRPKPLSGSGPRTRFGGLELHCRLLPFLGDSPFSSDESLKLLQGTYELGFSQLLLTPHVMQGYYDPNPAQIRYAAQKLGAEARPELPRLRLQTAANYYTDKGLMKKLAEGEEILSFVGDDLTLPTTRPVGADRLRYVLLETSLLTLSPDWNEVVRQLHERGCNPVLAQAERYVFMQQTPERALHLYETGVRFQVDIASLTGANGAAALRMAYYLVKNKLVSFVSFYPAFDRFMLLLRQAVASDLFQETVSRQ